MPRMIAVYNDYGINARSLSLLLDCLQKHICQKRYTITEIKAQDIISGILDGGVSLLILGGGFDLGFLKALGSEGIRRIRDYVESGGSYLGLCAGGYFASSYIEFDKGGPLQVCGPRELQFYPGICIGPVFPGFKYQTDIGTHAARITVNHSDFLPTQPIHTYCNGGGYFQTSNHRTSWPREPDLPISNRVMCDNSSTTENEDRLYDVHVLARYKDNGLDGHAAIVKCHVGKGRAILSGVHFEYDPYLLEGCSSQLNEDVLVKLKQSDKERVSLIKTLLSDLGIDM